MKIHVLLLLVLVLLLFENICGRRYTEYARPFNGRCRKNSHISFVESSFSFKHYDRRWLFKCTRAPSSGCQWYRNTKAYVGKLTFKCPKRGAISAIKSRFDATMKDRTFKFKCCKLSDVKHIKCFWTCPQNSYHGVLRFKTKRGIHINGIYSSFNKIFKDRVWTYYVCKTKRIKKPPC